MTVPVIMHLCKRALLVFSVPSVHRHTHECAVWGCSTPAPRARALPQITRCESSEYFCSSIHRYTPAASRTNWLFLMHNASLCIEYILPVLCWIASFCSQLLTDQVYLKFWSVRSKTDMTFPKSQDAWHRTARFYYECIKIICAFDLIVSMVSSSLGYPKSIHLLTVSLFPYIGVALLVQRHSRGFQTLPMKTVHCSQNLTLVQMHH